MESKEFSNLINKAIQRKNKRVSTYKKYVQNSTTHEVQKIFESLLDKEQKHLELLELSQENANNGSDLPIQAYADANLVQNDDGHLQRNLDPMMQSRLAAAHSNPPSPTGRGQTVYRSNNRVVFSSRFTNV